MFRAIWVLFPFRSEQPHFQLLIFNTTKRQKEIRAKRAKFLSALQNLRTSLFVLEVQLTAATARFLTNCLAILHEKGIFVLKLLHRQHKAICEKIDRVSMFKGCMFWRMNKRVLQLWLTAYTRLAPQENLNGTVRNYHSERWIAYEEAAHRKQRFFLKPFAK